MTETKPLSHELAKVEAERDELRNALQDAIAALATGGYVCNSRSNNDLLIRLREVLK